jgi:hypothetical protein
MNQVTKIPTMAVTYTSAELFPVTMAPTASRKDCEEMNVERYDCKSDSLIAHRSIVLTLPPSDGLIVVPNE